MRRLIEGSDYTVRLIDFPDSTIGGAVIEDSDGYYSIYLNSRCSFEQQRQSFIHEMTHLKNDDFHNDLPITTIERI